MEDSIFFKRAVFFKLIYRFNAIMSKFQHFFSVIDKLTLKYIRKGLRIASTILKKNEAEGLPYRDFNTYYIVTVMTTV